MKGVFEIINEKKSLLIVWSQQRVSMTESLLYLCMGSIFRSDVTDNYNYYYKNMYISLR